MLLSRSGHWIQNWPVGTVYARSALAAGLGKESMHFFESVMMLTSVQVIPFARSPLLLITPTPQALNFHPSDALWFVSTTAAASADFSSIFAALMSSVKFYN